MPPLRPSIRLIAVLLALADCGATEGQATSAGDLNGTSFSAVDSVYSTGITPPIYLSTYTGVDQLVGSVTGLLVSSDSHACGDISNPMTPGSTGLCAILFADDGQGNVTAPAGPDVFYVFDPTAPFAEGNNAVVSEEPCAGGVASGGTFTLTEISPNLIGSYDVTFEDGSEVKGTFNAVPCSAATCD
jgi:hypothetical protein